MESQRNMLNTIAGSIGERPNENTVTISKDQLFSFADYKNPGFAKYVQDQLIIDSKRLGMARRVLCPAAGDPAPNSRRNVGLKFDLQSKDMAEQMREEYTKAQESKYVREDRDLIERVQSIEERCQVAVKADFNLNMFVQARARVTNLGIPVTSCLVGSGVFSLLICDSDFQSIFDPAIRYEHIMTGMLGHMLGMDMFSDAYRHPTHRVIDPDSFVFFGSTAGKMRIKEDSSASPVIFGEDATVTWSMAYEASIDDFDPSGVYMLELK